MISALPEPVHRQASGHLTFRDSRIDVENYNKSTGTCDRQSSIHPFIISNQR